MEDSTPPARVVALVTMLRAAPGSVDRDALLARGLNDADPYVRRMAASWLGSPRTQTSRRQAFFEQARWDADVHVRAAAAQAQQAWDARECA